MKILFLDMDGVLNSARWFHARHELRKSGNIRTEDYMYPQGHIEPEKVRMLNEIVKRTGCKIVLSSSWRKIMTFSDLNALLCGRFGFEFTDAFIDRTPGGHSIRGLEIQDWLNGRNDVENFVILDDDSDMDKLSPYLVQTDWETGMTEVQRDEVIRRLS